MAMCLMHVRLMRLRMLGIAVRNDGHRAAEKRSGREISSGSCRAEMSQGDHEQCKADAVSEESDHAGRRSDWKRWNRPAQRQANREIDRTGNQSLELNDLE